MKYLLSLSFLLLTAAPFFPAATVTNAAPPPPPVATKFLDLFDRLRAAQEKAESGKFQLVTFLLSEDEINHYLAYSLKATPRPGIDSINIKVFSNDYISTFTRLDFDALESWRPGTIPAALKPALKGKRAIWIDFRIHAEDSKFTFTVEKARYDDVPLPPMLVTKLIQVVAARQPEQYDTTKPMPIPFALRKVWTAEHTIQGRN